MGYSAIQVASSYAILLSPSQNILLIFLCFIFLVLSLILEGHLGLDQIAVVKKKMGKRTFEIVKAGNIDIKISKQILLLLLTHG